MKKSVKRSLDAYIRQMDRIDLRVIACVILLNVFGLIMIYSASAYSCSTLAKYNYDSLYLLKKQGIFVLAGIVVMLLLQYFNYNYLQKLAPIIFLVSVGSLFLLRTGLAVRSHGAARWIRLGPVQLQVAELVKIAMVIMIAAFVAEIMPIRYSDSKIWQCICGYSLRSYQRSWSCCLVITCHQR